MGGERDKRVLVEDLMTPDVVVLNVDSDLTQAAELMRNGRVRHMPVVDDDGVLQGLITHRDLLRVQIELVMRCRAGDDTEFVSLRADEYMTKDVTTVAPDVPAVDAAELLLDHKFGCLPVVRNGRLVGILTEADFLSWTIDQLEPDD